LFPNTAWSLIRQSQEVANPQALQALDQLARSYWRPLYAFVRSLGYDQHWAEDAVQRFFEQLVSRDSLRAIIPGETRFRSFLITCLKHSIASEHRAEFRQKRGGGVALESLTDEHEEGLEGAGGRSAEEAMDREWALEVFERAFAQLEADAAQRGRAGIFAVLKPILRGDAPAGGYAAVAKTLASTEAGARKMVFDLRARLGVMIRREVAATVVDPAEEEDELRYLLSLL
jgi:RNA polymerase sigma factor (sigma-70 family)